MHIHKQFYIVTNKESYSRVNESKQQVNSFIIYNLDSIERVNGNWQSENLEEKKNACEKNAPPRLDLAPFERPIAVWSGGALTIWATGTTEEIYQKLRI